MIKTTARSTLLCLSLFATQMASAGDFRVSCSYKSDNIQRCANIVSDIVTKKFTDKYPSTKFEIFVHSNITGFTNGGYSAYAVAGVVPTGSGQFPIRRFSSTTINGTDKKFSAVDLARTELETYRSAVQSLMDACEISADCNVYSGR